MICGPHLAHKPPFENSWTKAMTSGAKFVCWVCIPHSGLRWNLTASGYSYEQKSLLMTMLWTEMFPHCQYAHLHHERSHCQVKGHTIKGHVPYPVITNQWWFCIGLCIQSDLQCWAEMYIIEWVTRCTRGAPIHILGAWLLLPLKSCTIYATFYNPNDQYVALPCIYNLDCIILFWGLKVIRFHYAYTLNISQNDPLFRALCWILP